jgi:RNA polymerase sigma factor for flagellar operon FliA
MLAFGSLRSLRTQPASDYDTRERASVRVAAFSNRSNALASVRAPTREELIQNHLGLVALTVARMSEVWLRGRLEREDAFSYGVAGLIHAVDNYDPTRGASFPTFALPRIRGAILDAVRRADPLPRNLRRRVHQVDAALLELANTLGRWPTNVELAVRTGLSADEVRELRSRGGSAIISLEGMTNDFSDDSQAWFQDGNEENDPDAAIERLATRETLVFCLRQLSPRDQRIVELRYGQSMTFRDIGDLLSLSESRVCQLHRRIMAQLQDSLRREAKAA